LLGGVAAKVGFDLYMRMLKKSIRKLRGLDLPTVPRTNIILPYNEGSLEIAEGPDGVTHAFEIPRTYIKDEDVRLQEEGIARLAENTEQLVEISNRWKENYGPLPVRLQVNSTRDIQKKRTSNKIQFI
jgi:transcription-repair coupling factor (superfamily II helicase)